MERNVGEIFEYNGDWYQCVIGGRCNDCAFHKDINCYNFTINNDPVGACSSLSRTDKHSIIFKKLEKVGEPYEHHGKLNQCYKLPMETEIRLLPNNCNPIGKDNLVEIAIKQTKEDMEEKKLNLKPFDIQKAREGKPVCTRDGRNVRIICFDRNDLYPIVALIECEDGKEIIGAYSKEGQTEIYEIKGTNLMMLPEKKEGWAVIRREDVYETEEQAKKSLLCSRTAAMIRKIEWEE